MANREIEKNIEHPLEEILEIEEGSTLIPAVVREPDNIVSGDEYDTKDTELDSQFQEIYETALEAYENQAMDAATVEPKYRARNHEVAIQYLNTALNAAKEKAALKQHKDKISTKRAAAGPNTVNQNLIVADRNDLLKHILQKDVDNASEKES